MKVDKPIENWTKFPNCILDNIEKYTSAELKVLCLMVRKNLGYSNPNKRFALTYIRDKTGLSKQTVITALAGLCQKGTIVEIPSKGLTRAFEIIWSEPTVQKLDRSKNHTGSGLKIRPEAVQKLDPVKENSRKKINKYNNTDIISEYIKIYFNKYNSTYNLMKTPDEKDRQHLFALYKMFNGDSVRFKKIVDSFFNDEYWFTCNNGKRSHYLKSLVSNIQAVIDAVENTVSDVDTTPKYNFEVNQ